jgi:hypothetical protein
MRPKTARQPAVERSSGYVQIYGYLVPKAAVPAKAFYDTHHDRG